jgi:Ni/Fe-hydrogenase subunit HybB-like protein
VAIHLVTAFLYAGLPSRPFWNSSLLGPRFLASAFAAGPALIILILQFIRSQTAYPVNPAALRRLAMVATVAAQINLIMLVSELFKEFYAPTHHSLSAIYLFFGLEGHNSLAPWIWTGIALNVIATVVLSVHFLREDFRFLTVACLLLFVGIWIEKGMGLIVPGFIPEPYGQIVEYSPTWIEILVTLGIWALGAFVFTILARVAIAVETGKLRYTKSPDPGA